MSLFTAALSRGHPFSRSYGVILPSSLTMLLPSALGFSPHPPVSVYGTGMYGTIAAFLDTWLACFPTEVRSASRLRLTGRICLPCASSACPELHAPVRLSTYVPTVLTIHSAGISTCCPSATTFVLTLGPDLPRADQLYPGILGYSAERILTSLSLLIPAFSLQYTPRLLIGTASPRIQCSSTNALLHSQASVSCFSPGHFRRRASRPVSCYALFKCMAASEPTSWLSSRPHILYHLTRTLGP